MYNVHWQFSRLLVVAPIEAEREETETKHLWKLFEVSLCTICKICRRVLSSVRHFHRCSQSSIWKMKQTTNSLEWGGDRIEENNNEIDSKCEQAKTTLDVLIVFVRLWLFPSFTQTSSLPSLLSVPSRTSHQRHNTAVDDQMTWMLETKRNFLINVNFRDCFSIKLCCASISSLPSFCVLRLTAHWLVPSSVDQRKLGISIVKLKLD